MTYTPPFTITSKALGLAAEIAENIGRLSVTDSVSGSLRLRRVNRVRTVHGSLADEKCLVGTQ